MGDLSRVKVILAITVVLGAVFLTLWGLSSKPAGPGQGEGEIRGEQGIYMADSRLVGRREGKRQWEIASATVRDDGENVDLANISQVIIFQDDEPYFTVHAQRGRWHRPTNDLELVGDIYAVAPDDFSLTTTRLLWEAETEILRAPEPLVVHYRDAVVSADSMLAQTSIEQVTLTGNVQVVQGELTWLMDELVYELDKDLMHIYGSFTLLVEKGSDE